MTQASTDAWMFLAICYGSNPAARTTLEGLIGQADYINHAIPNPDEVRGGLNRLIEAGLVDLADETFGMTAAGLALHAKAGKRAYVWTEWKRLEQALDGLADPATPAWTATDEQIRGAITAYLEAVAAAVSAHDVKKRSRRKAPSGPD